MQGKRRILSGGNPVFQHIHHCGGFSPKKLQQLPGVHGIPHRRQIDAAIVCSGMQPAVEAVGREIMHHIKIILLVQTILIPAQTSSRFHDTLPHIEFSLFFCSKRYIFASSIGDYTTSWTAAGAEKVTDFLLSVCELLLLTPFLCSYPLCHFLLCGFLRISRKNFTPRSI